MTKNELMKIKDESGSLIKVGGCRLLEKFSMWCAWYRKTNQGKLPIEWTVFFNEDTSSDFDPNTFKIGSKYQKATWNMKQKSPLILIMRI